MLGLLFALAGCVVPTLSTTPVAPVVAPTAAPPAEEATVEATVVEATHEDDPSEDAAEQPITIIPLPTPLNDAALEYSGLAWHGDRLVLLPQYPSRYDGQLPMLDRNEIVAYLRGDTDEPLTATPLRFYDGGLSTKFVGFEGYEAIAFDGDRAYLTVETHPGNGMLGYVVSASVTPDGDMLQLAPMNQTPVPVQAELGNMTDETLVIDGERLLTIYEANGANVNSEPAANVFSLGLEPLESISFPTIEYRITDATALDEKRRFWAINYFYPGDSGKLEPAEDGLVERYGEGPTHRSGEPVERLLEFQVEAEGIHLVETPPVQLTLSMLGYARNWEGIVRLQEGELDGFLLITDKYPGSMLAFVPRPMDADKEEAQGP